jgi:hypothetical protein
MPNILGKNWLVLWKVFVEATRQQRKLTGRRTIASKFWLNNPKVAVKSKIFV